MIAREVIVGTVLAVVTTATATLAQPVDRSEPPEPGPPPRFDAPDVHRFELSNGLPVFLVESHRVPLVQLDLVVRAGSIHDPADLSGLASLTADMLDEGAGGRDALELADAIDFLGARLSTGAGHHTASIRLHTPLSKLDEALPLMADVALRPAFDAEELARKRVERLTRLLQWRDEASTIATIGITRVLYGEDHPYGRLILGDEKGLTSVSTADLAGFHRRSYAPDRAYLVVVGDVTPTSMRPRLEEAFGSWTRTGAGAVDVPETDQVETRTIHLVDKPGAAQSEIRIGRIGVERTTDDYVPLVVMNAVLGGAFTSRLNQNLREDKGYSYGAWSYFDFRPAPGPFVALAAVETAVTDEALTEFVTELERILEPVPQEELERARDYVALRFPQDFETVAETAGEIDDLPLYDLPLDYYDTYVERVLAVTAEDVRRVARTYLDPERVAIVVVGDREAIEEGIRALDLGPVEILEVGDVLGPPPDPTSAGE